MKNRETYFWKHSSNGKVAGIEGRQNFNVRYIAPTNPDYRGLEKVRNIVAVPSKAMVELSARQGGEQV